MHDIGFIASKKDGEYTLNVYAAGGLGGRPIGADLIEKEMKIEDILICTTALMRIFTECGNRKHRNKARMKFIKDSWGLEEFIRKYREEVNRIKESEYGQSLLMDVSKLELDLPKEAADLAKLNGIIEDQGWVLHVIKTQRESPDLFMNDSVAIDGRGLWHGIQVGSVGHGHEGGSTLDLGFGRR